MELLELGLLAEEAHEAVLVLEQVAGGAGDGAVERERLLALAREQGVVVVQRPVARADRALALLDPVAALDAVLDARAVAQDERGAGVRLRLTDAAQRVLRVGVHADLRDVHVLVQHRDQAEVLLVGALARGGELVHGAHRGRLRLLPAGVRVDLRVEHDDVDVGAEGEDVVEPLEVDVVRPAVAADDPRRELRQHVLLVVQVAERGALVLLRLQQRGEPLCDRERCRGVVEHTHPLLERSTQLAARRDALPREHPSDALAELLAQQEVPLVDPEPELGVLLEQRVRERRTPPRLPVQTVRCSAVRERDGGRAARGVGDHHALAEELGQHLQVRHLATPCTRPRELEERLLQLRALQRGERHQVRLGGDLVHAVVPVLALLRRDVGDRRHGKRLLLCRAAADARATPGAVVRRDLHPQAVPLLAVEFRHCHRLGRFVPLHGGQREEPERRRRTERRAHSTLDTLSAVPDGDTDRDVALLVSGRAVRGCAVCGELGHGELVPEHGVDRVLDVADERGKGAVIGRRVGGARPLGGDGDLHEVPERHADGVLVLLDDGLTLLLVRFHHGVLEQGDRAVNLDDPRELEEDGLHNAVDEPAKPGLAGDFVSVDDVELGLLCGEVSLDACGKLPLELVLRPHAVQDKGSAVPQLLRHRELLDVIGLVASDVISLFYRVRGRNRALPEAQVRGGDPAGLVGGEEEVPLRVHLGLVADQLDGVFVCADRAVGAHSPEDALGRPPRDGVDGLANRERQVRHVVVDTDGEARLCLGGGGAQVLVHRVHHRRGERLVAEPIPSAEDADAGTLRVYRGTHVQIQRLTNRPGLFRPVEDGNPFAGLRKGAEEVSRGERAEQVHGNKPDLVGDLCPDVLAHRLCPCAHHDDHVLRLLVAVVVEQVVLSAGDLGDVVHSLLDDIRAVHVVLVRRLLLLEVQVSSRERVAVLGVCRVHRPLTVLDHLLRADKPLQHLVRDHLDVRHLVRDLEPVEKVHERQGGTERREVCHGGEVHHFLDGLGVEHRLPALARRHDVRVVAEDARRDHRDRACCHVEDHGELLAGDLEEVRDHQQQALRCGERRCQGAGSGGAMQRAGSPAFALHLGDLHDVAEDVLLAISAPRICKLCHRRRGGDRVDECQFAVLSTQIGQYITERAFNGTRMNKGIRQQEQ